MAPQEHTPEREPQAGEHWHVRSAVTGRVRRAKILHPLTRVRAGMKYAAIAYELFEAGSGSYGNPEPASWAELTGPVDPEEPAPRCPTGGPGCTSRSRELQVHTGPMGARVGYYSCPRCGWISGPFTIEEAS